MIHAFAINKSGYSASYTGGSGFKRPIDVVFSKEGDIYVVDFALSGEDVYGFLPNIGVI